MTQEPLYLGIDVSKAALDVDLRPTAHQRWSVPNDEKGIGELVRRLGAFVSESSGAGG